MIGKRGQLYRHAMVAWTEVQEEVISVAEQTVEGVLDMYPTTRLIA